MFSKMETFPKVRINRLTPTCDGDSLHKKETNSRRAAVHMCFLYFHVYIYIGTPELKKKNKNEINIRTWKTIKLENLLWCKDNSNMLP